MQKAITAIAILTLTTAATDQQPSSKARADQLNSKPPAPQLTLTEGSRPETPGGVFYKDYWGGFWGRVESVTFSPDGRYLLSAGSDKEDRTVRLWDVATGEEMRRYHGQGHDKEYQSVAFSPDAQHVLAGSRKNRGSTPHMAWLWETGTTKGVQHYDGHTTHFVGGVNVAFSPDGNSIVTTCVDGPVLYWDASTGEFIRSYGEGQSAVYSHDGRHIATGARKGLITIWNASTAKQENGFLVDGTVRSMEFSPDDQNLLVHTNKDVLYLNATTGQTIHQFAFEDGTVHCATISPDGQCVLIGTSWSDPTGAAILSLGRTLLYDLTTGNLIRTYEEKEAFDGWVTALAFSPDGKLFAAGSQYGPIRLWNVLTGQQVRAFYGHLGRGPHVVVWDYNVQVEFEFRHLDECNKKQRGWIAAIRKQQQQSFLRGERNQELSGSSYIDVSYSESWPPVYVSLEKEHASSNQATHPQ